MFIKNLTSSNLVLSTKGEKILLIANETTLVPDGLVTEAELKSLFGNGATLIMQSGPSTSVMMNQQVVATGKLYLAEAGSDNDIRLFVGASGSVDVYGSDSQIIPASFATMSCPEGNDGVTGVASFGSIPRYIAFKTNTGTPEIIITNCKLTEVKSIS